MKKLISLSLAAIMFAAAFAGCVPAKETAWNNIRVTSSDAVDAATWLTERLGEVPGRVVIGTDASGFEIDLKGLEDDGYVIRDLGGETAIFAKTADGLDRAVRRYAKAAESGDLSSVDVTYHEGYRVKKLTLAGNCIRMYSILIPEDADECVTFAAYELSGLIADACGVKPIVATERLRCEEGTRCGGKVIELRPMPKDGELGEEGFDIRFEGDDLIISGGEVRGCLYGVYDFLEDAIGYRFLTSDFTYLYEADAIDVPADYVNTHVPVLAYRYVYDSSCRYTYKRGSFVTDGLFAARRKHNNIDTANEARYGYCGLKNAHHGMSTYVKSVPDNRQPCLTDESVLAEAIENIREYLEAVKANGDLGTRVKAVDLGENDNPHFCTCKSCKAALRKYGTQSGLFVNFTNQVAEDLEEDYPDIRIGMFAYWGAIQPPLNIKMHKNVQLCYVMYGFCPKHPLDGSRCDPNHTFQEGLNHSVHQKYINEWQKLTDNIQIWFYTVDFWEGLVPFLNVDDYTADFRWLASQNLEGVFCQNGQSQLTFDELYVYLQSLLAWDPYMSDEVFEAKLQEFMRLFYGEGWWSLYTYLMEGCRLQQGLPCGTKSDYDWYAENFDYLRSLFDLASANCDCARQEDDIELLSLHMYYQALCGLYEDKYINGTEEEREEMQALSTWLGEEFSKYRIKWLGLESAVPMSAISFDLSVLDPRQYENAPELLGE